MKFTKYDQVVQFELPYLWMDGVFVGDRILNYYGTLSAKDEQNNIRLEKKSNFAYCSDVTCSLIQIIKDFFPDYFPLKVMKHQQIQSVEMFT